MSKGWQSTWLLAVASLIAVCLFVMLSWRPTGISDFYFVRQDVPIVCAMIAAGALFPYLALNHRWGAEIELTRRRGIVAVILIIAFGAVGSSVIMFGYDLSRDQSMASFAAQQIARGELITSVPEEWQPFGRAMFPAFFLRSLRPELAWASAYLPVNSTFRFLGSAVIHPAIANPVLLAVGIVALWKAARQIWPSRPDAAVVTILICATSSQLLANSMTSFAMIGHFALNMVWLALFLRNDGIGIAGALVTAFLAMGLHQFHFHPMFAAPFVFWLIYRRQWYSAAVYALGYLVILWFWMRGYPAWLLAQADPRAIIHGPGMDLWTYIIGRISRLFDYSAKVWFFNFIRFFTWQNVVLLPLVVMALPALWRGGKGTNRLILPIAGSCVIGLIVLVFQGQGFGYRYLSGVIGCFCLLAGYGWIRLVPQPGPSRAWAMVKAACCFTLFLTLPTQLAMARNMVSPYARLHTAVLSADADVILIDTEGGFLAQDLVQNGPDFSRRPKTMDLALVPTDALERLCSTKSVMRIDRRHYRAAGMREGRIAPQVHVLLQQRRPVLDRLECAPPMPFHG